MKYWWRTEGWPWTKENWWVLVLAPVMLVVVIGMVVMRLTRRQITAVIDPVGRADARSREEIARRIVGLETERGQLKTELEALKAKHQAVLQNYERQLLDGVEQLRRDPEKLKDLMLRVGRGQP